MEKKWNCQISLNFTYEQKQVIKTEFKRYQTKSYKKNNN